MRTLPATVIRLLTPFAPMSSERVWHHSQVVFAGAILAPERRNVSYTLRAMGLRQQKRFHRYHRILNRASWSSLEASRVLLRSLIKAFVPEGPLVVGIGETLKQHYGKKTSAKDIYRAPVHSSHKNFIKAASTTTPTYTNLAANRSRPPARNKRQ